MKRTPFHRQQVHTNTHLPLSTILFSQLLKNERPNLPLKLANASLAEAQPSLETHATSQGYVFVTKRTKRVGRKKEGDVKVVYYQCSQSNAPIVRSGQDERARPSRNSGRVKQIEFI